MEDTSSGIPAPVIRVGVGENVEFVLRNISTRPVTSHPQGVFYEKDAEGAMRNDGTTGAAKSDDAVAPGSTFTCRQAVPERAGPGPNNPSSIIWRCHSHVDSVADTNSGLVGSNVVTAKGQARDDATPRNVDREVFSFFTVMDENQSLFIDEMTASLAQQPADEYAGDFEEPT